MCGHVCPSAWSSVCPICSYNSRTTEHILMKFGLKVMQLQGTSSVHIYFPKSVITTR
jgi:hypothetical protein